jgi:hypothetical protein
MMILTDPITGEVVVLSNECKAPNCVNGKVFGETCKACKGTGYVFAKQK